MRRSRILAVLAMAIASGLGTGCAEMRERPTVPVSGQLAVNSDPSGASITIDGEELNEVTPHTVQAIPAGNHAIKLFLDAGSNQFFRWEQEFFVLGEQLVTLDAALEGGCGRDCPFVLDRGRVVCRFNNFGDTCASFFFGGGVSALQWPGEGGDDFGAGGRLLVAAIVGADGADQAGDTLATQSFRQAWTGRQPVTTQVNGSRETVQLEYWATARFIGGSILGLAVEQSIVAVDSAIVEDMLFIHFKLSNVTADPRYQKLYPIFPAAGYTFEQLYLGFGLDADVGAASDDLASFDAETGLGFIYDADFSDSEIGAEAPALVGLLTLEPPAGADQRTRTLWRAADDWDDGTRPDFAWRILAGRLGAGDPIVDHPSPDFGFVSDSPDDYRLTESFGPSRLAPGEAVEFTVALLFAAPVPGAFVPGALLSPGDPTSMNRQILDVARGLKDLATEAPGLWARYRP